jgi:lysophospholipase L1-like esterase
MNINPEAVRVLCFGDSNTWGYISGTGHERFLSNERWPGILQKTLGTDYEIIEEGLNSRAISQEDWRPGKEGRNAMPYIIPCLDTHDPLDWIVIMLGSNELKGEYNLQVEDIKSALEKLLDVVENRPSQFRQIKPRLILVSPPLVNENAAGVKFERAGVKSQALGDIYKEVAQRRGIFFLNAAELTETGPDGVHITKESHRKLGLTVAAIIRT